MARRWQERGLDVQPLPRSPFDDTASKRILQAQPRFATIMSTASACRLLPCSTKGERAGKAHDAPCSSGRQQGAQPVRQWPRFPRPGVDPHHLRAALGMQRAGMAVKAHQANLMAHFEARAPRRADKGRDFYHARIAQLLEEAALGVDDLRPLAAGIGQRPTRSSRAMRADSM